MNNNIKLTIILIAILFSSNVISANDDTIFVGANIGYSKVRVHQKDEEGGMLLEKTTEGEAYNSTFELGYCYDQNIEVTLNYQSIIAKELYLDNFSIGTNYRISKLIDYTPYIGAAIGYSKLTWDKEPIDTTENDYISGSYFIEISTGVMYQLLNGLDLRLNYSLQMFNHKTLLESSTVKTELNTNASMNFNVGVRFSY